jgi:hypothetical protein
MASKSTHPPHVRDEHNDVEVDVPVGIAIGDVERSHW